MLEFAGRGDVPVYRGADAPLVRERRVAAHVHGESGLDGPDLPPPRPAPRGPSTPSTSSPGEIRARDGRLTLVPTGPLTNIALLLALHPDARPERIVLMGGSIGEGNRTPAAEFNIWADPEAAKRVFASGIDTTMIGLDVTHQALITDAHTERLRGAGRVGADGRRADGLLLALPPPRYPDLAGSPMHDPVARRARAPARASSTCASALGSTSTAAGSRAEAARTSTGAAAPASEPNASVGRRHRRGRVRRARDRAHHARWG